MRASILAMAALLGSALLAPVSAADVYSGETGLKDGPDYRPAISWAGLYVGVFGGYGWGDRETSLEKCRNCFDPVVIESDSDGWLGGVTVGANAQRGSIVFGIEADFAATGMETSDSIPTIRYNNTNGQNGYKWDIESEVEYLSTFRGRVGVLLGPSLLAYGTGGLAWARVNESHHAYDHVAGIPAPGWTTETANDHFGWTAGGGIEWQFNPGWTLKTEYLYVDLGTVDYIQGSDVTSSDLELHLFKAGVNYRF